VEPMKPGDPHGEVMNAPKKYVAWKTLNEPTWRNTTIIRDNPIEAVRKLKAESGKNIVTDGSSQLVHALARAIGHDILAGLGLEFPHRFDRIVADDRRVAPGRFVQGLPGDVFLGGVHHLAVGVAGLHGLD